MHGVDAGGYPSPGPRLDSQGTQGTVLKAVRRIEMVHFPLCCPSVLAQCSDPLAET